MGEMLKELGKFFLQFGFTDYGSGNYSTVDKRNLFHNNIACRVFQHFRLSDFRKCFNCFGRKIKE
jgi:hypothetical protein